MNAQALFQQIYKQLDCRIIRGAELGMHYDQVKKLEAGSELWGNPSIPPTIECIGRLLPNQEDKYSLVYQFNDQFALVEVNLYLDYSPEENTITFADYQRLTAEFDQFFRTRYGQPVSHTMPLEDPIEAYEEVSFQWIDRSATPAIQINQLYYPDPFNDKPRVMKLIYQQHNE